MGCERLGGIKEKKTRVQTLFPMLGSVGVAKFPN